MSNNISDAQKLTDLFTDAAREVIERQRIKAQMARISQVVEADKRRLTVAYAEIGKMYIKGTLDKNPGRYEMLLGTIKHLESRIERAAVRYAELQKAHSVDECTEAFKAEMQTKVNKAKEVSVKYARDLSDKAKLVVGDLGDVAADALDDAKIVAADATTKVRVSAEDIVSRAMEATRKVKEAKAEAKKAAEESAENMEEEAPQVTVDVDDILGNIAAALDEMDNAVAETESPAEVQDEVSEEASSDVAENPAEESPESFTF